MLVDFTVFWNFLREMFSAIPSEIVAVASFAFCGVGLIGVLRSL